jgi:hypothetical protein
MKPRSEYEFKGGYPTAKTVQKAYDDTDLARAIQAYKFFYPTVSIAATWDGNARAGLKPNTVAMLLRGESVPDHLHAELRHALRRRQRGSHRRPGGRRAAARRADMRRQRHEPALGDGMNYGDLAALGIEKGNPFKPDARMKKILENAAKIANAQMRVRSFADRRPDRVMWRMHRPTGCPRRKASSR